MIQLASQDTGDGVGLSSRLARHRAFEPAEARDGLVTARLSLVFLTQVGGLCRFRLSRHDIAHCGRIELRLGWRKHEPADGCSSGFCDPASRCGS